MSVDAEHEAGDRAEVGGDVEPPSACPEVDADGTENRAGGEDNVEPPADQPDPNVEAEQAVDGVHAPRPTSPWPEQQTTDPKPGFTRTFPNVREFLAFAKAELRQQEPSSSSEEEALRAREERVAMEEELLNAQDQRLSNLQKKLQQRLHELEAQKKVFLKAEEAY